MVYPSWNWLTGILILIAILSDALDGYFARRAKAVTHFGKWLDPAADFIVTIFIISGFNRWVCVKVAKEKPLCSIVSCESPKLIFLSN